MDCSTPGLPVHHHLPEFTQTHVHRVSDAIQPSHPLSPLLLPPSILPSIRVFSNESVRHIRWPKYWSFSFSISPSNEYSGMISFRMDWLDLLAVQGTLKNLLQDHSSKALILGHSAFFTVQLSHPDVTTGKPIALTRWTFVGNIKTKTKMVAQMASPWLLLSQVECWAHRAIPETAPTGDEIFSWTGGIQAQGRGSADACRGHRQWGGHTLLQAFSLQTPLGADKQDWQTPGSRPWCWCSGWADTAGGANPLVPLSPPPPAIKALTGEGKGSPGHSHGAPVKTHCSWEKETGTLLSHRWGESRWERGQHREGQLSKIQDAYLPDRHQLEQRTSLPLC